MGQEDILRIIDENHGVPQKDSRKGSAYHGKLVHW
jgi:hypothetical protein